MLNTKPRQNLFLAFLQWQVIVIPEQCWCGSNFRRIRTLYNLIKSQSTSGYMYQNSDPHSVSLLEQLFLNSIPYSLLWLKHSQSTALQLLPLLTIVFLSSPLGEIESLEVARIGRSFLPQLPVSFRVVLQKTSFPWSVAFFV